MIVLWKKCEWRALKPHFRIEMTVGKKRPSIAAFTRCSSRSKRSLGPLLNLLRIKPRHWCLKKKKRILSDQRLFHHPRWTTHWSVNHRTFRRTQSAAGAPKPLSRTKVSKPRLRQTTKPFTSHEKIGPLWTKRRLILSRSSFKRKVDLTCAPGTM